MGGRLRRAHVARRRQVEAYPLLPYVQVRAGVQPDRGVAAVVDVTVDAGHLGGRGADDGGQPALRGRAQPQTVAVLGAVTVGGVHLRARQHQPHRPAADSRRRRGEQRVRIDRPLGAETAAQVGGDDPDADLLAERLPDAGAGEDHALGALVQRQRALVLPDGGGGVRLDRIVVLHRAAVGLVDPYRGLLERRGSVAADDLVGPVAEIVRQERLVEHVRHPGDQLLRPIAHLHQGRGLLRLLQGLRHDVRDGLPLVVDPRVLHGDESPVVRELRRSQLGHVGVGVDRDHAGMRQRRPAVDLQDLAPGDRAHHQGAVQHPGHLLIRGVAAAPVTFARPSTRATPRPTSPLIGALPVR